MIKSIKINPIPMEEISDHKRIRRIEKRVKKIENFLGMEFETFEPIQFPSQAAVAETAAQPVKKGPEGPTAMGAFIEWLKSNFNIPIPMCPR